MAHLAHLTTAADPKQHANGSQGTQSAGGTSICMGNDTRMLTTNEHTSAARLPGQLQPKKSMAHLQIKCICCSNIIPMAARGKQRGGGTCSIKDSDTRRSPTGARPLETQGGRPALFVEMMQEHAKRLACCFRQHQCHQEGMGQAGNHTNTHAAPCARAPAPRATHGGDTSMQLKMEINIVQGQQQLTIAFVMPTIAP